MRRLFILDTMKRYVLCVLLLCLGGIGYFVNSTMRSMESRYKMPAETPASRRVIPTPAEFPYDPSGKTAVAVALEGPSQSGFTSEDFPIFFLRGNLVLIEKTDPRSPDLSYRRTLLERAAMDAFLIAEASRPSDPSGDVDLYLTPSVGAPILKRRKATELWAALTSAKGKALSAPYVIERFRIKVEEAPTASVLAESSPAPWSIASLPLGKIKERGDFLSIDPDTNRIVQSRIKRRGVWIEKDKSYVVTVTPRVEGQFQK